MTREDQKPDSEISANVGYAGFQFHKALLAAQNHDDPLVRQRAKKMAGKWIKIIEGMHSGFISTGSRVPVKGLPKWVTLEVVTGGFATGSHLAGGDLLEFERELINQLQPDFLEQYPESNDRQVVNFYFLGQAGLEELIERLESGLYEILVPEEGALLVTAWLIHTGQAEIARKMLAELIPFFSQIRFYPRPSSTPAENSSLVFLRDVTSVMQDLKEIEPTREILAQWESISVWQPMYDRVVSLFLETVEGEAPVFTAANPRQDGTDQIYGGVPYEKIPADFAQSARHMLLEIGELRERHTIRQKSRRKDNFRQLCEFLEKYIESDGKYDESDVARIRMLLARYVCRRGAPGSERQVELRKRQAQQIAIPLFADLAKVVIQRLDAFKPKSGIEDLSDVVAAVSAEEKAAHEIPLGGPLPDSMVKKIERCLMDSIDGLIDKQIIKSGDSLAVVLPQITANLSAAGVADAQLRLLYSNIYQAFRKRRSLLLMNYESQVRIEELPWIEAIGGQRQESLSGIALAKETMAEVAQLTLRAFPYAIIPNKLLQEFRALAKTAKVELPLVDELAADIFMGSFSNKFILSAQLSGELLKNSLYETYYKIDFDKILNLTIAEPKKLGGRQSIVPNHEFAKICMQRAGNKKRERYSVAANGTVIEQQQILTTQNLAALYLRSNLRYVLAPYHPHMAKKCFEWICNHLQIRTEDYHARLVFVKNSAYAWRQMIFYLSMIGREDARAFSAWAKDHLDSQNSEFRVQFQPALAGLYEANDAFFEGRSLSNSFVPFYGWTIGRHWFLPQEKKARD